MPKLYSAINELVSHGNKITPVTFRVVFDFLRDCALVKPDWATAPEWARWWAVDADGQSTWFATEPHVNTGNIVCWTWNYDDIAGYMQVGDLINLPLGYDWRLSKQQRP